MNTSPVRDTGCSLLFSLPKILLLLLVCGVAFYLFGRAGNRGEGGRKADAAPVINLAECARCGKWRDSPCRKKGCPLGKGN